MTQQMALNMTLRLENSFDNFYVSEINRETVDALRATLMDSGFQVFYLYGEDESGRTHLLEAACLMAQQRRERFVYLPLNEVANDDPATALRGLENCQLVCLDAVDAVLNNPEWEEQLFHFYNRARERDIVLLLSADSAPAQLEMSLSDLRSRLGASLVYRIYALDDDSKKQCLQLRAQHLGLAMPGEVAEHIMRRADRTMNALCEVLDRLDRASLAAHRRLTIAFVKQVMNW
jgi:DnaA family protein